MGTEHDPESDQAARIERFSVTGPLELELSLAVGRIEVHLDTSTTGNEETAEATVEIRHDPSAGTSWASGMQTLLSWLGEGFGGPPSAGGGAEPNEAIGATRVEQSGNRLLLSGPRSMPARAVPLAVTVHAPADSQLRVRTTSAQVTATGPATNVEVSTGSGSVSLQQVSASSSVRTGSGEVDIGRATGTLSLRTGSGATRITDLDGNADVVTGTATAWIGKLGGELFVRAGSGDIVVGRAHSGSVELISGSGDIRIGIGRDALAEIDVSSGAGRVHSELDVADTPPHGRTALTVHARTGTGDTTLTRASS